jgi:hypothetical protein
MPLLLFLIVLLSGCALIPISVPPALKVVGYVKTGIDAAAVVADEQTSNDVIVSTVKEKQCKTRNVLEGKEYCDSLEEDEEYKKLKKELSEWNNQYK